MKKYCNLDELLQDDPKAKDFFMKLPGYAQETIKERSDSINTFDSMRAYARNITRGDG